MALLSDKLKPSVFLPEKSQNESSNQKRLLQNAEGKKMKQKTWHYNINNIKYKSTLFVRLLKKSEVLTDQ
jgi:hypothetical protein